MNILIKAIVLVSICAGVSTVAYPQDMTTYLDTSQAFERIVTDKIQSHRMPRIEDKNVAEMISTLSDSERFLDSIPYHLKDIDFLMKVCEKANAAVMSYSLFDLKNNIDNKADPKVVALQVAELMERNIQSFQDELAQLQPFTVRCMAKQIPLITEFLQSLKPEEFTNVRREGVKKMREGMFGSYFGFLQITNNLSLKESYRANLLKAISETATLNSSILHLKERRQILDLVIAIKDKASDSMHSHLEKIAQAMSQTGCEGLCKF